MVEQVLYRKHRPQSFADVIGQPQVTTLLQNAIKLNRVAHAYLFSGPRGTGKTTVARILAKGASCEKQKSGDPCNMCQSCKDFLSGTNLDLIEIDAASSRGIDEIRELREAVRLAPARGKFKVYIIDEVHMLTKEAFNALLKTLEEPPAHAIFILATTEREKVPETIASRTQQYEFRKIAPANMIKRLAYVAKKEGIDASKDALQLLTLFADGGLRDAESMLGQIAAGRNSVTAEDVQLVLGAPKEEYVSLFLLALLNRNAAEAARVANEAIDNGTHPQFYLKMIIRTVRHMLLQQLNPQMAGAIIATGTTTEQEFLGAKKPAASVPQLEHMLKTCIDAYWMSYRTVYPQIPLELAVIEILRDDFLKKEEQKEI